MRRMYSDGQVVKVVNKAIEAGEIQAGGLPKIESGDAGKALVVNQAEDGAEWAEVSAPDNVLVLPEVAPAAQQLVGINTSGEQNALSIGDGLEVNNNTISAPVEIIKIDCQNKTLGSQSDSLTISDELAEKLKQITTIVMLTNVNSNHISGMLFAHRANNNLLYNITFGGSTNYSSVQINGAKYDIDKRVTLKINGTSGSYYLTVSENSYQGIVAQIYNQCAEDMPSFTLDSLTGTKTMPNSLKEPSQSRVWSHVMLNNGDQYVRLFIQYIDRANPHHLFATGEDDTYKYTLSWYGVANGTHTSGEYTITKAAK